MRQASLHPPRLSRTFGELVLESQKEKLVMIVDDEPDIVTYMATVLDDAGYRTVSAPDTESALAMLQRIEPDLLCLDIMMPRRSGISLYSEIKKDPRLAHIPVLIVSAFSRLEDFTGARFRRIVPDGSVPEPDAFLEKPIQVRSFLETVEAVLSRSGIEKNKAEK